MAQLRLEGAWCGDGRRDNHGRARFEQTLPGGSTPVELVLTPMGQTDGQPQRSEDQDDDQRLDVCAHRASMLQSAVPVREESKDESRGGGSQPISAGD